MPKRSLLVTGLVVTVLLAAAAAAADYHYVYAGRPVPLDLDNSRVALFDRTATDGAGLRTVLHAADVAVTDVTQGPLPGWWMGTLTGMRSGTTAAGLVAHLGRSRAAEFVSPVFTGERGNTILITPDLLVGFRDPAAQAAHLALLGDAGAGRVIDTDYAGLPGVYRVRSAARDGLSVLALANALAADPSVKFAEPDMVFTGTAAALPDDPLFGDLWGLHNTGQAGGVADIDVDAPEAWNITAGDDDILIVVLDTGVQQDHPDLHLGPAMDFTTDAGAGGPMNECDIHATWVAGCATAAFNNGLGVAGVAPGCRVASARIGISNTPTCNLSWSGQLSWTVDALFWAETSGARVTNNSNAYNITSGAIREKYDDLRDQGVVHFASAGNNGDSSTTYPASLPAIRAVAAIDRTGQRAAFSNYGGGLAFSAPGVEILTTDRTGADGDDPGDYHTVQGTSFASPYAAGVAALVLSYDPALSAYDVENIINRSCTDLGTPGFGGDFGWGLVNAAGALDLAHTYPSWTWRSDAGPTAVSNAALAYDVARGDVVLFGGLAGFSAKRDTWTWDGATWTLASTTGPAPRYGHTLAYDSEREVVVLFGGFVGAAPVGDTWEWNGTTWTQRTPAMAPSPRFLHAMAYDSARGVTVLFGGRAGLDVNGETWEWDGDAWLLRSTIGPSPRSYHGMAYDAARGVSVLFGGNTGAGETWTWDGTQWLLASTTGPEPRERHALAFDDQRDAIVLFGGYDGDDPFGDTWEWDGAAWRIRSLAGPAPRHGHAMTCDAARGQVVLFGGYDEALVLGDTWEWQVAPRRCRGDANCDGLVNWRDIDFFVAAQNDNTSAWAAMFAPDVPSCPFANNDANDDGAVNWRDIDPFVALQNTTCP